MLDFAIEPECQEKLDRMATFVRQEAEPLDLLFPSRGYPCDTRNEKARAVLGPLQAEVRKQGLWACHLGPELGGHGYGQVTLGLMSEILGRSHWTPTGPEEPDRPLLRRCGRRAVPRRRRRGAEPHRDVVRRPARPDEAGLLRGAGPALDLDVLVSEGGAARVPFIADQRKEAYRRHARAVRPKLDRSPGEIIDARVYTSSQHDRLAIPAPTYMEYENVRWGSDYGHPEGTYGHTEEILHELFDRVDDAVRPPVTIDAFTGLFPGVPPVPAADESAVAAATGVRGLA